VKFTINEKDAQTCTSTYLLSIVGGETMSGLDPLLRDLVLVGKKLEGLGAAYHQGKVVIIEPGSG